MHPFQLTSKEGETVFLYGTTTGKTNDPLLLKVGLPKVALAALALEQNHVCFARGCVPRLTGRATGIRSKHKWPRSNMYCNVFHRNGLRECLIALPCEFPDAMKNFLRARQTSSEGLFLVLAGMNGTRRSWPEASEETTTCSSGRSHCARLCTGRH